MDYRIRTIKRCPECRRDYYDETLHYCLDDGNALLDGPASANEQATAIMPADREDIPLKPRWLDKKVSVALVVTLAVLIIAGVGFGVYKFAGNNKTNISFESAKFTRLTNSGKVARSAISPDGKWLVYATSDGAEQTLWLQQVAVAGSSTQIGSPAALFWGVTFSPDGNYVYYTVWEEDGALYRLPVLGGNARKLLTGISGNVSFSPDGKQIAYLTTEYGDVDEDRLMIANADGTGKRQLAARRGNEFFYFGYAYGASWSPDGKTIVTTVGTVKPRNMTVAAVSVETGEITPFTAQKFNYTSDVNWLADGKSVLLLAGEQYGIGNIWQISYPSGEAKRISSDLNDYFEISLTADSNILAVLQGDGMESFWVPPTGITNIWTAPINNAGGALRVTSSSDRNYSPSWTRDGKIVYVNDSGGSMDLYLVDPQGGSPRQLTANSGSNYNPSASPDGRYIVFTSDRTGTPSLWRIDIDGTNPKQLTSNWDFGPNSGPSFSPDGREIIYTSNNGSKATIWKVGIDGGEPVQLTDRQSDSPIFSPDGKQFVCSYQADQKSRYRMSILAFSGGGPIKSFALPNGYGLNPRWMPDGRSIVYGINKGGVTNLWAQPIDGGAPRQITNFTNDLIHSFDFSRDGKQIAFTKRTGTSDVVLISGFRRS